jgi:hypothetical protein
MRLEIVIDAHLMHRRYKPDLVLDRFDDACDGEASVIFDASGPLVDSVSAARGDRPWVESQELTADTSGRRKTRRNVSITTCGEYFSE